MIPCLGQQMDMISLEPPVVSGGKEAMYWPKMGQFELQ